MYFKYTFNICDHVWVSLCEMSSSDWTFKIKANWLSNRGWWCSFRQGGVGGIQMPLRPTKVNSMCRKHWCMWFDVTLTGTPWAMRIFGFMMVTSWCRRSGWNSNSSGVSFFITSSSRSAAIEGTPYQVLGSPLEMEDTWGVKGRECKVSLSLKYTYKWHTVSALKSFLNKCIEHAVPVQVVDGVAPVIFNVPAESWEHHAHVEPWHLHPRDVSINMAQEWLL